MSDNNRGTKEHSVTVGLPRYELIDKDGHVIMTDSSPSLLAGLAKVRWPDQEQDPDRTGRGWDVQVCSDTPSASRASHYS